MILSFAPLHGITNKTFRAAWCAHFTGFDYILAPFILSVRTNNMKKSHFRDLEDGPLSLPGNVPLIPQILGNDSQGFLETTSILKSLGFTEVNWNLGCPYPQVAKKRRGSGLLCEPETIRDFLDRVCSASPLPVSVKMRLGRHSASELDALISILNSYPLAKVILHPRLGVQMYKGICDEPAFERALSRFTSAPAWNGDIKTVPDIQRLTARFPAVTEYMIGRSALCNPFLPALIRGLSATDTPLETMHSFHDHLFETYSRILSGRAHILDKMKEVWSWISPSFEDCARALHDINRSDSLEEYSRAVNAVFSGSRWLPCSEKKNSKNP